MVYTVSSDPWRVVILLMSIRIRQINLGKTPADPQLPPNLPSELVDEAQLNKRFYPYIAEI